MEEYKNKLGSLANKLKTDAPKIPIQEVHPVKPLADDKEEEAQLNTWIGHSEAIDHLVTE